MTDWPDVADCFGVGLASLNKDQLSTKDRMRCYHCSEFERCFQVMLIKSINDLRFEIKESSNRLKNALGGSHSNFPFG